MKLVGEIFENHLSSRSVSTLGSLCFQWWFPSFRSTFLGGDWPWVLFPPKPYEILD